MASCVVAILIVVLVCGSSASREPQCSCSRFYYEEQLLEKTVRLGLKYEELEKSIKQVQDALRTVSFSSKAVKDMTMEKDQVIVFTEVLRNDGSGYDPNTGIFTAPVGGTYLFTAHLCPYIRKFMHYSIVADGIDVVKGLVYDKDAHVCGSASAVIALQPLQKVWVKCQHSGDKLFRDAYRWNVFSGVRLHGNV